MPCAFLLKCGEFGVLALLSREASLLCGQMRSRELCSWLTEQNIQSELGMWWHNGQDAASNILTLSGKLQTTQYIFTPITYRFLHLTP